MPERPPIDIVSNPKGGSTILPFFVAILTCVVIFAAMFFGAEAAHKWNWANKYAAGMAQMESQNVSSMSKLCETFMRPDLVPVMGEENVKGWSDICLRHAKKIEPYVK